MTLNQIIANSDDLFVAVVEIDESTYVGVLDDPVGLDLNNLRLAHPLEVLFKPPAEGRVELGFIRPEFGLPEEIVLEPGAATIYRGNTAFAKSYFKSLDLLSNSSEFQYLSHIIGRPPAKPK